MKEDEEDLDEFESLKAHVRDLMIDVPSKQGCLRALEEEGITGPLAIASVEAAFNEAKDEARARRAAEDEAESEAPEDYAARRRHSRVVGIFMQIPILFVAFIAGTWFMGLVTEAGFLSPLHILFVGGTYALFRFGYTALT